ncbi:hypothetical protein Pcinc_041279 [Petrolisthes cinctipes]|uniref:Uncharacterized protein n=1 Tax=Petrolisthes cinctipes TaxID=88211 RepID=A0AAE1EH31_PETCI|nr:hypothetical protein Pcinc_041279 [Petrolisthes cinctipes]
MFTRLNQTSVRILAPPVVISDISIYDFDRMCTEAHIAAPNIRQDLQRTSTGTTGWLQELLRVRSDSLVRQRPAARQCGLVRSSTPLTIHTYNLV